MDLKICRKKLSSITHIPIVLDKPLIEKHPVSSIHKPYPLKENPRHEVIPNPFLPGQQDISFEYMETYAHESIVCPNPTAKLDSKNSHNPELIAHK